MALSARFSARAADGCAWRLACVELASPVDRRASVRASRDFATAAFDYVWNRGVRHLVGGPALPPNPPRRRDAFKVATVWLAVVGALLTAGATTVALVLGGLLVAACATVTATNLCLPSETFAWLERRRAAQRPDHHLRRAAR